MNLIATAATAASLTFFGFGYVVVARVPKAVHPPLNCDACKAKKWKNPDDPGAPEGYETSNVVAGVTITGSLTVGHGSCVQIENDAGIQECYPDDNCTFSGNYTVRSSIGKLIDNQNVWVDPPGYWECGQSTQSDPFGAQTLTGDVDQWIASCNGSDTWRTVDFFSGPFIINQGGTICQSGVLAGSIKFIGVCEICPLGGV